MGFTKTAKTSAVGIWSKVVKTAVSWILYPIISYLKREQGDYLLTEAGGKIVIAGLHPSREWTKEAKPSIP